MTINGITYDYPQVGDTDWGPDGTDWASAVTSGMLQKAGGLFQLLAEADFGSSFGLKSLYYKTRTTNVASSGQFRLARADVLSWRNQANSADLELSVDASDNLLFNGTPIVGTFTVADTTTIDLTLAGSVLSADINNDSITNVMINSAAAIQYSKLDLSLSIVNGDISNSAAIAYSKLNLTGSIVNADISASAAIAFSKLAALTDGNILIGNGSNVATSVAVTGDVLISNTGVTSYNGIVPLNKGGTNKNMTAVAGGVVYTDADSMEVTSAGTSGQYLKSNGSSAPAFTSFTPPTIQKFTSGSGTYMLPAGVLYIRVVAVGGGGGGGGSGTTGGTDGGAGGNTTFGTSLIVASGGAGGIKIGGAGGAGGGATLGSGPIGIAVVGSGGAAGNNQNTTNQTCAGGNGAPSALGGGARGTNYNSAGANGETNSGGGGSGGGSNNVLSSGSGGGGGSGGYVDAIITSPSATYSYAVGAGGSVGSTGTSGAAGGAGGSGQIIVYEFYH